MVKVEYVKGNEVVSNSTTAQPRCKLQQVQAWGESNNINYCKAKCFRGGEEMAPNSKRAKKTIFTRLLSTTMFSVNGKKESRGRSLLEPYLCGK